MESPKKQGLYKRYDHQKGENSTTQRSAVGSLAKLEHEISQLEDELEELKAYKKQLEENVEVRKKASQKLELHKYACGIVVISVTENEVVFEFNAMVENKCTGSYCMRVAELDDNTFTVLKYYMPVYMDVRGLLKKPEFQNNIQKYLNHIHSCLRAYNDRKQQVKEAERKLNKNGIKIANTMDYRLLEITMNMEEKKNKEVIVVVVLKYKDNEVRPNSISVECKDLSNAASEEIRGQLNDLHIYSLDLGLQVCLLKNELLSSSSDNSNKGDKEVSIESATTVELPQSNFRHLEVGLGIYKRTRGSGRASSQQRSIEPESETSEEEEDQKKQKPRRGRVRGSRSRGTERGVGRGGRGQGGRRDSNKGRTLDISKYFERSNP